MPTRIGAAEVFGLVTGGGGYGSDGRQAILQREGGKHENTQAPKYPSCHRQAILGVWVFLRFSPLPAWSFGFDSHNGRVLKLAVILACALVLVTGCNTAPPQSAKPVQSLPDWGVVPTNDRPALVIVTNPPVIAPPPTNEIVIVPVPPKTNTPTNAPSTPPLTKPEETWLSLDRWAKGHGLENLRRTALTGGPGFALPTGSGVLTLRPGSLSAGWDGLEFRLGFSPRLIEGQLYVHALDLRKNIAPLLHAGTLRVITNKVIVLDPGHGGQDPGTHINGKGRHEKTFTLDWALRTARLLEAKGWRVFLTRTNDADVPLAARVAFAETHHADLFLSLHFNSAGTNSHDRGGLETYCLTPTGMPSSLTRGYEDKATQTFPNNAFDEQNFLLALQMHRTLLKATGGMDRGVRRARFLGVLQGQNRPAVLVEGGYLSNATEARRIGEPAFRQKMAEAVVEAVQRCVMRDA